MSTTSPTAIQPRASSFADDATSPDDWLRSGVNASIPFDFLLAAFPQPIITQLRNVRFEKAVFETVEIIMNTYVPITASREAVAAAVEKLSSLLLQYMKRDTTSFPGRLMTLWVHAMHERMPPSLASHVLTNVCIPTIKPAPAAAAATASAEPVEGAAEIAAMTTALAPIETGEAAFRPPSIETIAPPPASGNAAIFAGNERGGSPTLSVSGSGGGGSRTASPSSSPTAAAAVTAAAKRGKSASPLPFPSPAVAASPSSSTALVPSSKQRRGGGKDAADAPLVLPQYIPSTQLANAPPVCTCGQMHHSHHHGLDAGPGSGGSSGSGGHRGGINSSLSTVETHHTFRPDAHLTYRPGVPGSGSLADAIAATRSSIAAAAHAIAAAATAGNPHPVQLALPPPPPPVATTSRGASLAATSAPTAAAAIATFTPLDFPQPPPARLSTHLAAVAAILEAQLPDLWEEVHSTRDKLVRSLTGRSAFSRLIEFSSDGVVSLILTALTVVIPTTFSRFWLTACTGGAFTPVLVGPHSATSEILVRQVQLLCVLRNAELRGQLTPMKGAAVAAAAVVGISVWPRRARHATLKDSSSGGGRRAQQPSPSLEECGLLLLTASAVTGLPLDDARITALLVESSADSSPTGGAAERRPEGHLSPKDDDDDNDAMLLSRCAALLRSPDCGACDTIGKECSEALEALKSTLAASAHSVGRDGVERDQLLLLAASVGRNAPSAAAAPAAAAASTLLEEGEGEGEGALLPSDVNSESATDGGGVGGDFNLRGSATGGDGATDTGEEGTGTPSTAPATVSEAELLQIRADVALCLAFISRAASVSLQQQQQRGTDGERRSSGGTAAVATSAFTSEKQGGNGGSSNSSAATSVAHARQLGTPTPHYYYSAISLN